MDENEKAELASKVHQAMESEGVYEYFCSHGPEFEDLVKLGFDLEKIQAGVKAAMYLDCIFGEVEEMVEI